MEQEAIAGLFRAPSHPGVELQKKKNIYIFFLYILEIEIFYS